MKRWFTVSLLLLISTILFSKNTASPTDSLAWKRLSGSGYTVYYTATDHDEVKKIDAYLQSGIAHITRFFNHQFQDTFNVYIFPDRSSLDKQWQKDWSDPTFKSECWMIASGVAHRLDILSPLDWLVEGVATYVSGQLDEKRYQPVRKMIIENKTPASLDEFWKGQNKYGLSGSMVAFIDNKYGRKKIFELLQLTNKTKALESLAISETQLLSEWKRSIQ